MKGNLKQFPHFKDFLLLLLLSSRSKTENVSSFSSERRWILNLAFFFFLSLKSEIHLRKKKNWSDWNVWNHNNSNTVINSNSYWHVLGNYSYRVSLYKMCEIGILIENRILTRNLHISVGKKKPVHCADRIEMDFSEMLADIQEMLYVNYTVSHVSFFLNDS